MRLQKYGVHRVVLGDLVYSKEEYSGKAIEDCERKCEDGSNDTYECLHVDEVAETDLFEEKYTSEGYKPVLRVACPLFIWNLPAILHLVRSINRYIQSLRNSLLEGQNYIWFKVTYESKNLRYREDGR